MQNSCYKIRIEEVKERADMVTSSIDDDGIYRAFETLGLLA